MHRCGSGLLLTLVVTFAVALTGCLGKSTSNPGNGGVETITLTPSSAISIDIGTTQLFSASARNASGGPVLGVEIQFVVTSGNSNLPAPISISSDGRACAGTWDATTSNCSPGTPGIAVVTAVANGASSLPTYVYVHRHIDSIRIVSAEAQPPQYDCFSQGQTWQFEGIPYNNNVDISNTVGPMTWSSSNVGVVTTTATLSGSPGSQVNLVKTTAKSPGVTQLFATVGGTTSDPYPYTTCLVRAIYLQIRGQGQAGNTITVNNGGSVPITATAVDTLYPVTGVAMPDPPLTWSTNNPEVAAFTTTTNSTGMNSAAARNNSGGATLTASCTPPTCNIGVLPGLPVYASDGILPNGTNGFGAISVDVIPGATSTTPTYTAWAATTGCQDEVGCSSALFPLTSTVNSGANPIGTILSVPRTPNSMMFNHVASARLYVGSDQGLMFVDIGGTSPNVTLVSGSSTPCNVALCGKILTISNDGRLVVISDPPGVSIPGQVHIYNGGSGNTAPVDLILSNPSETATAAAFSPDQLKLFILTDAGNMYVYSTVDKVTSFPIATSATDVKFSADGSFGYVAGTPLPGNSISGFATCNDQPTEPEPPTPPNYPFVTTLGIPLQIFPSPDGQHVLALDPPNGGIDIFTTTDAQIPLADGQFTCNAPTVNFSQIAQPFNLGQGRNFIPIYAQLVNDGTEMIIVAQNIHAVLIFNVNNGTTSSIQLSGSASTGCPQCTGNSTPLAAAASTDGSQVFVAACDQYQGTTCIAGSVHLLNTILQSDFQQVPYLNINDQNNPNMCNNQGTNAPLCLPNLIAIRPQ